MSNIQYVFIDDTQKPTKNQLEAYVAAVGYTIEIDQGWDDPKWMGFLPCKLNGELDAGCEVAFGPITEITQDIEDEDELERFSGLVQGTNYFIELGWHSDYLGGATAALLAAALMKACEAISSYEAEEPDSFDSLMESAKWHIDEYKKERK